MWYVSNVTLDSVLNVAKIEQVFSIQRGTPLHVACKNGHTETAQLLIDRGADVNQVCVIEQSCRMIVLVHDTMMTHINFTSEH